MVKHNKSCACSSTDQSTPKREHRKPKSQMPSPSNCKCNSSSGFQSFNDSLPVTFSGSPQHSGNDNDCVGLDLLDFSLAPMTEGTQREKRYLNKSVQDFLHTTEEMERSQFMDQLSRLQDRRRNKFSKLRQNP